jgi:hypothetical protein
MLDCCYNLLPESERVILRRLSMFVGAFSLEAAQFVAALKREQTGRTLCANAAFPNPHPLARKSSHAVTFGVHYWALTRGTVLSAMTGVCGR